MTRLLVSKNASRALPNAKGSYTGGAGWDNDVDLDVWVLRYWDNGTVDPIYWGNEDWKRPDLGRNAQGNPYIATPEMDVIFKGDDQHGTESEEASNKQGPDGEKGYDEKFEIDLSKTPAGVTKYEIYVTNYKDPKASGPDPILGEADNIVCGVKDSKSGNELQAPLGDTNSWDVTAHVCTIDVAAGQMTNVSEGSTDDMFTVATRKGVTKFDD
jgi:stress response protein SCP2